MLLVTFSFAAAGSLVCLSAEPALKLVVRTRQSATIALGVGRGDCAAVLPAIDPVVRFGFIVACYGTIALAVVSALPGAFALERTGLAFALLGVGGLIGEISSTPIDTPANSEAEVAAAPRAKRVSLGLSLALTLMLNLAFAVLSLRQDLVEILPPKSSSTARVPVLDPIVVVAQRTHDRLDRDGELL